MGFTNHIQERELQQASFESTPVRHVGISRPLAQENNPYKFWGVPPLCKQWPPLGRMRPWLEHGVQLRAPQYKKDMDLLEQVQRKTVKIRGWEILACKNQRDSWRKALDYFTWRSSGEILSPRINKYLMGGSKDWDRLLSAAHWKDERQWEQAEILEIQVKHEKKKKCILRAIEHWNRLPRQAIVSILGCPQNWVLIDLL